MSRNAIELQGVTRNLATGRVLGPIDLVVRDRETIALVGPSGSGKSTLLRLIVGLAAAHAGRVSIFGEPMTVGSAAPLRRAIGYVIQEGGLFPHWTGAQNAVATARALKWPRERIAQRLEELTALVGLDAQTLCRYPLQLSGGERQRVALMRALFLDPRLLVFDEPLGALDPLVRFRLESDLKQIFAKLEKSVVWVTHDLEQAAFLCEELVLLRDGQIEQRGGFGELVGTPANDFVREFVAASRTRTSLGAEP